MSISFKEIELIDREKIEKGGYWNAIFWYTSKNNSHK
jgi:hypothetical protein